MITDHPPADHCLASRARAREEALGELRSLNVSATATRHAERAQLAFNAGDYTACVHQCWAAEEAADKVRS